MPDVDLAASAHEVFVATTFTAVHQIVVDGALEPVHGHDFSVAAWFASTDDPSHFRGPLQGVLHPISHTDLAAVTERPGEHPSAERLAEYVLRTLLRAGQPVERVSVGEAPGCTATVHAQGPPTASGHGE